MRYHPAHTSYEVLLDVDGLVDHVDFLIRILGRNLDPIIGFLSVCCLSLGEVDSSGNFEAGAIFF